MADLDPHAVEDVLRGAGVATLYHANSVRTSCSFLAAGGLLSRGAAAALGYDQTPQRSDEKDQEVGVWYDVFLDGVDIHDRARRPNKYGPVLFCFSLDLLRTDDLPPLRVTRDNPIHWPRESGDERRYFASPEALQAEYSFGDFGKMITLRKVKGPLRCFDQLERIVLDDPARDLDGVPVFDRSVEMLEEAAGRGELDDIGIERRRCAFCRCKATYEAMSDEKIRFWFL